jgi:hypothetical protein
VDIPTISVYLAIILHVVISCNVAENLMYRLMTIVTFHGWTAELVFSGLRKFPCGEPINSAFNFTFSNGLESIKASSSMALKCESMSTHLSLPSYYELALAVSFPASRPQSLLSPRIVAKDTSEL